MICTAWSSSKVASKSDVITLNNSQPRDCLVWAALCCGSWTALWFEQAVASEAMTRKESSIAWQDQSQRRTYMWMWRLPLNLMIRCPIRRSSLLCGCVLGGRGTNSGRQGIMRRSISTNYDLPSVTDNNPAANVIPITERYHHIPSSELFEPCLIPTPLMVAVFMKVLDVLSPLHPLSDLESFLTGHCFAIFSRSTGI